MNYKYFAHIIFAVLISLSGCNLEPLEADLLPSFDKLYSVAENVEAVDFVCKPDASGYIIVGNLKSEENSDIIIIDVDTDGIQRAIYPIKTPFYDEAISIKLYADDNSVLIMGNRGATADNVEQNILLKANLDGRPVGVGNSGAEDSVFAEFKTLNINNTFNIQLNDFLIVPPNLITVGKITQASSGNYSRITQIFDLANINFSDSLNSTVKLILEKPARPTINFDNADNSENLKILKGNNPNSVYEVMGQSQRSNPNSTDSSSSIDIVWEVFTDVRSPVGLPIFIGTEQNEIFGDILPHSNGKNYITGNYEGTETVFLIIKEFTGFNNNRGQQIQDTTEYGERVTSLTEDDEGNIIIATIDQVEDEEIYEWSKIMKFSQSGIPIEEEDFVFKSTGFYNIKKIESEPGNILVILSQKTFENNSTAIGLMKIKF